MNYKKLIMGLSLVTILFLLTACGSSGPSRSGTYTGDSETFIYVHKDAVKRFMMKTTSFSGGGISKQSIDYQGEVKIVDGCFDLSAAGKKVHGCFKSDTVISGTWSGGGSSGSFTATKDQN